MKSIHDLEMNICLAVENNYKFSLNTYIFLQTHKWNIIKYYKNKKLQTKMKLTALLLISCLALSIQAQQAESSSVIKFFTGVIQGLQNDSSDQSQCILAFQGFEYTWN